MKQLKTTTILAAMIFTLMSLATCGGPSAPRKVEELKLETLLSKKIGAWEGSYNKFLNTWTFEQYAEQTGRIYVENMDERPALMEAFAKKIEENDYLDATYVFKVTSKEKIAGGFIIKATTIEYGNKEAKDEPAFLVVKEFKTGRILCRSGTIDRGLVDAGINFCKSLK